MAAANPKALMSRAPGSVSSIEKRAELVPATSKRLHKRDLDPDFDINHFNPYDYDPANDMEMDPLADYQFDPKDGPEWWPCKRGDGDICRRWLRFARRALHVSNNKRDLDVDFDINSFNPYDYDPANDMEMDPLPEDQFDPKDGPEWWLCKRGDGDVCRRALYASNNKRDDNAPAPTTTTDGLTSGDNIATQASDLSDATTNSPGPADGSLPDSIVPLTVDNSDSPLATDGSDSADSSVIIVMTGPTDTTNPILTDDLLTTDGDSASSNIIQVPAAGSGLPVGTMIIIPGSNQLSADDAADLLDASDLSLVTGCAGLGTGTTAPVDDDSHCIVEGSDGVSLDSLQQ